MTKKTLHCNDGLINSALIIYRPSLKGFFYSRIMDILIRNLVSILFNWKSAKQIVNLETIYGVSGIFALPCDLRELRKMSPGEREHEVGKAVILAIEKGAQKISLAGQLASCLNYCEEFSNEDLKREQSKMTTGHALTCLGVVKTFEHVLRRTRCQVLAIVGVGSIGQSSTILLLEKIMKERPIEIILCDVKAKQERVRQFSSNLETKYHIKVSMVFYDDPSFERVYEADMLLGASSAAGILQAEKLKSGAILIDDSFPPVIDVRNSINRMKRQKDVLIIGGGKLVLPDSKIKSMSRWVPQAFISLFKNEIGREGLPGCWLEAILFAWAEEKYAQAGTKYFTHGIITSDKLLQVWGLQEELNLKIPPVHFYKYKISESLIKEIQLLRR